MNLLLGYLYVLISFIQFSSVTQLCLTLCDPMNCSTPGLPVHHQLQSLLKLMSTESVMPSNHLILHHPFSSHFQSFPVSGSFQMSQFFASGLSIRISAISFSIDWFDLLAVQGTFRSLL